MVVLVSGLIPDLVGLVLGIARAEPLSPLARLVVQCDPPVARDEVVQARVAAAEPGVKQRERAPVLGQAKALGDLRAQRAAPPDRPQNLTPFVCLELEGGL